MLYLGIDQHSKQITVCVRNEQGEAILRRQVSTKPEKIKQFFDELLEWNGPFDPAAFDAKIATRRMTKGLPVW